MWWASQFSVFNMLYVFCSVYRILLMFVCEMNNLIKLLASSQTHGPWVSLERESLIHNLETQIAYSRNVNREHMLLIPLIDILRYNFAFYHEDFTRTFIDTLWEIFSKRTNFSKPNACFLMRRVYFRMVKVPHRPELYVLFEIEFLDEYGSKLYSYLLSFSKWFSC